MEVTPASSTAGGSRPTTLICPATHDPSRRAAPPSPSLHHPGPYPDSWTPRRIHRRLRRPTVRPPARQQQRCPPNRPPSISFCFQQGYVLSVAGVYPKQSLQAGDNAVNVIDIWRGSAIALWRAGPTPHRNCHLKRGRVTQRGMRFCIRSCPAPHTASGSGGDATALMAATVCSWVSEETSMSANARRSHAAC